MLETKEQKRYIAAILVMILILTAVSLWQRPKLNTGNLNNQNNTNKISQEDYNAYLASIQVDTVASKDLYEQIISEEEVKKEIEQELQVGQKVTLPKLDESKIKITNTTGSQAMVEYFKQHLELLQNWKDLTTGDLSSINDDFNSAGLSNLSSVTQQIINQFYNISVPKEAKLLHESQLTALEGYADLFTVTAAHQSDPATNPWPQVYRDQVVLETTAKTFNQEFDRLDAKYSITRQLQKEMEDYAKGNFFIRPAYAIFGLGDIVIDIKAVLRDVYRTVLTSAYVQFTKEFLDKLITKIEANYKIANFLYYTDALVSGQYVDDYLNKYVNGDELDKAIIKNFIPQISCNKNQDFAMIFKAKANQYLGFDPDSIDPNDPQYYQKMAKVGSFMSSPNGWRLYYQDVASQAQAQAQQSAQNELLSQGLKAGRDPKNAGEIAITAASITESLRSALYSFFNVGTVLADTTAGMIAGTAIQTFIHSYLFKGVVLKEQKTCIAVPQISPVLPFSYVQANQAVLPTNQAIEALTCSEQNALDADCTSSVLGELSICAYHSSQHTGTQSCGDLASSSYVNALLQYCHNLLMPTSNCTSLQDYLHAIH